MNDDVFEMLVVGKGCVMLICVEQEVVCCCFLVVNIKEVKVVVKVEFNECCVCVQVGMVVGEEKYFFVCDKGLQCCWVCDYVDVGWYLVEFVMGVMVFVIFVLFLLINMMILFYVYIVMMGYFVIVIGGMILFGMCVKCKVVVKFGKDCFEWGFGWYVVMCFLQMWFMCLLKLQVKCGQYFV